MCMNVLHRHKRTTLLTKYCTSVQVFGLSHITYQFVILCLEYFYFITVYLFCKYTFYTILLLLWSFQANVSHDYVCMTGVTENIWNLGSIEKVTEVTTTISRTLFSTYATEVDRD